MQRDSIERYRRGKFLQTLALAEFRQGKYSQAIRLAFRSVATLPKGETKYSSPIAGGYAILAMSHFKAGNMEQANDYRNRFDEALNVKTFREDPNVMLLADELKELFASQPVSSAVESAAE